MFFYFIFLHPIYDEDIQKKKKDLIFDSSLVMIEENFLSEINNFNKLFNLRIGCVEFMKKLFSMHFT